MKKLLKVSIPIANIPHCRFQLLSYHGIIVQESQTFHIVDFNNTIIPFDSVLQQGVLQESGKGINIVDSDHKHFTLSISTVIISQHLFQEI